MARRDDGHPPIGIAACEGKQPLTVGSSEFQWGVTSDSEHGGVVGAGPQCAPGDVELDFRRRPAGGEVLGQRQRRIAEAALEVG
jgi:hypothetical protein